MPWGHTATITTPVPEEAAAMFINIEYNSGGLVFQEDEPSLSECRDVFRTAETLANGLNAQGRRAFGMAKYKQH